MKFIDILPDEIERHESLAHHHNSIGIGIGIATVASFTLSGLLLEKNENHLLSTALLIFSAVGAVATARSLITSSDHSRNVYRLKHVLNNCS